MIEIKDNTMIVTHEDGSEESLKILFYYNNPERKKDFYFIYKEDDPENVIVMASSDGKELQEVNDEEFEEAQEMFETYENDPKIAEAKK
ncbi:MAG: hypothetical protein BWY98_01176 [Tenericutes bacterium ADurb.BinA155]|jgi:uncharacterized protein YrzB (UPF0473 family)|nr:MAG: hypothetical protein BWY98_01176 [Tenericutes bacterium ADurb.BinA155]